MAVQVDDVGRGASCPPRFELAGQLPDVLPRASVDGLPDGVRERFFNDVDGAGFYALFYARTRSRGVIDGRRDQATTMTADFSIDNVGFFKGVAPTDPPMPSP